MQKIDNETIKHQTQEPGRLIFPHFTEQEQLDKLKNNPSLYQKFQQLNETWKNRFLEVMTGKKLCRLPTTPSLRNCFNPIFIRSGFPV